MGAIFGILLSLLAIFLILLVLVQRGRGGGLAGALGGVGGSSAFGAKAGDVFTRITIVTAIIWGGVCVAAVYWANNRGDALGAATTMAPSASPELTEPPAGTEGEASETPAGPAIRPPATTQPATEPPSDGAAESSSGNAAPATGDATPSTAPATTTE